MTRCRQCKKKSKDVKVYKAQINNPYVNASKYKLNKNNIELFS